MISLNLLPPEEKKQAYTKKYYLLVKNELLFLLITALLLFIITLTSRIILAKQLTQINEGVSLVNPIQIKSRQQIVTYNEKLKELKNIQNEFIPWSNIIWKIFNKIPQNINIKSISLNSKSKTMIMEGFAATRQDLLNFEENIKNSQLFSSYNLPLKSKLKKENINFTITAQLNLEQGSFYE